MVDQSYRPVSKGNLLFFLVHLRGTLVWRAITLLLQTEVVGNKYPCTGKYKETYSVLFLNLSLWHARVLPLKAKVPPFVGFFLFVCCFFFVVLFCFFFFFFFFLVM